MFRFFKNKKELYTIEFKYKGESYRLKTLAHDKSEAKKNLRKYFSEVHNTTIYNTTDIYIYHTISTKKLRDKYKKTDYSVKKIY